MKNCTNTLYVVYLFGGSIEEISLPVPTIFTCMYMIYFISVDFGQEKCRDRGVEVKLQNKSQGPRRNHWKTRKEK